MTRQKIEVPMINLTKNDTTKNALTWAMLGITMLGLVALLGVLDRRTRDQYDARRWYASERQICAVTS